MRTILQDQDWWIVDTGPMYPQGMKGYNPQDIVLHALMMSPQSVASIAGMTRHVREFERHEADIPAHLDYLREQGIAEPYLDNGVEMWRLVSEDDA